MPPDPEPRDEHIDRLSALERQVAALVENIGHHGQRPDDPTKAERWDVPLYWHVSELRDAMHALRNAMQVLVGLLERNAGLSTRNSEAIARLDAAVARLADRIEANIAYIAREKPLLIRDLWRSQTDLFEAGLSLVLFGETIFYLIASEALVKSAMFQAMALICPYPAVWALFCGAVSIGSTAALFSRRLVYRRASASVMFVYFMVTGALPVAYFNGVLGTWHHMVFGFTAFWIVARKPSNAI